MAKIWMRLFEYKTIAVTEKVPSEFFELFQEDFGLGARDGGENLVLAMASASHVPACSLTVTFRERVNQTLTFLKEELRINSSTLNLAGWTSGPSTLLRHGFITTLRSSLCCP